MKRPWLRRGVWLYGYEQIRSDLHTPVLLWGSFILGLPALAFGIIVLWFGRGKPETSILLAIAAIAWGLLLFPVGLTILIHR